MLSHCEILRDQRRNAYLAPQKISIMTPMMFDSYYDFSDLSW